MAILQLARPLKTTPVTTIRERYEDNPKVAVTKENVFLELIILDYKQ